MTKKIGKVLVEVGDRYTVTTFPDGRQLVADHSEQYGQAATALRLGYANAEEMNKDHDLAHSLLAAWLGLDYSQTLHCASMGTEYPFAALEEDAVFAIQRFAKAVGIRIAGLR